jgi:site-specific DNA-cytosine methylase
VTTQAFSIDSQSSNSMKSRNPVSGCRLINLSKTLDTACLNPTCNQGGVIILHKGGAVRRLTPLESERLQGFPDNWTEIATNPSTSRYKQIGNAIAVPLVEWLISGIVEVHNAEG